MKKLLASFAVVVIVAISATNAWAIASGLDPYPNLLTGTQGKVVIGERQVSSDTIQYYVDVLDESTVHAFAVSFGTTTSIATSPAGASTNIGWQGIVLAPVDWNNNITFTIGGNTYNTNSLGTYASNFGTDPLVALFFRGSSTNVLSDLNDQDQTWTNATSPLFSVSGGVLESHFVALNGSGQKIDFTPVPEPSTFALAGIAAVALGWCLRRRIHAGGV